MADPMYRQIAQGLRQRITSGELAPGQQLPTELELCDLHGASRNTIRDAIKWLTTNGLVETKPGRGTFVVVRIDPFVTTLSGDPETGLGGGEGDIAFSEARNRGRSPSASVSRVEVRLATGNVASGSASRRARTLSAGIRSASSTAHLGPCRPPSIR